MEKEFNSVVLKSLEQKTESQSDEGFYNEADVIQNCIHLKHQVIVLEKQVEEKNKSIRSLQQQMVSILKILTKLSLKTKKMKKKKSTKTGIKIGSKFLFIFKLKLNSSVIKRCECYQICLKI